MPTYLSARGQLKLLPAALSMLGATLLSAPAPAAVTPDIKAQTRTFLDAYARGDQATIVPMLDGEAVTIYGSDLAEVYHGTAAAIELLANDQRLWGGPATIGEIKNLSIIQQGTLASVFFNSDFSAGGRPPVPVRFAMVWRLSHSHWLLVQSSNVVPTQGQSAAELLKRH